MFLVLVVSSRPDEAFNAPVACSNTAQGHDRPGADNTQQAVLLATRPRITLPEARGPWGPEPPRGRNSVVECQLPKLDVAGSSPVARSLHKTFGNSKLPLAHSGSRQWRSVLFSAKMSQIWHPVPQSRCGLDGAGN